MSNRNAALDLVSDSEICNLNKYCAMNCISGSTFLDIGKCKHVI